MSSSFGEWLDDQDSRAFLPVELVRERFRELGVGREEGSPGFIASLLGRSAKYWREHMGEVQGAYRDPDTDRIYLPVESCRAHLERKRQRSTGKLRGPQKRQEAASARTASARPASVAKRPVHVLRFKTVGRTQDGDAKPEGRRMARTGSKD